MNRKDIKQTEKALKKVEQKYGGSKEKAREFLAKMGYLEKSGKVSAFYKGGKKSKVA